MAVQPNWRWAHTMVGRVVVLILVAIAGDPLTSRAEAYRPLDLVALLNAEYQLPVEQPEMVRVRDGRWYREAPERRESLTILDIGLRGDLDADGNEDAVMLLIYSGGGSGVFYHLAAVLNDKGHPRFKSSVELGDRVKIVSVTLKNGRIQAQLIETGADDPACCPTHQATHYYSFAHGKLSELGGAQLGLAADGGRARAG